MATEHRDIPDAERHEVKGAALATLNHILKSDGDGTTSFVDPLTLSNIQYSTSLSNSNTASINPSATDTPLLLSFTSTVSNTDVDMDDSGLITINTDGVYDVAFNMNFGRANNTGTAIILVRLLINDVQYGYTQAISLNTNQNSRPLHINLNLHLEEGDELKVQIMRDSAGANDGGLVATAVTAATWGDAPSWFVRIARILGAS